MSIDNIFQMPVQGYQKLVVETAGDEWRAYHEATNNHITRGQGKTPELAVADLQKKLDVLKQWCGVF